MTSPRLVSLSCRRLIPRVQCFTANTAKPHNATPAAGWKIRSQISGRRIDHAKEEENLAADDRAAALAGRERLGRGAPVERAMRFALGGRKDPRRRAPLGALGPSGCARVRARGALPGDP